MYFFFFRISVLAVKPLVFITLKESESESEVAQSCPTLCNPMDCSPPGSSVHGILQARIKEWFAISSSRGLPDPGIELVAPALSEPPGKAQPDNSYYYCNKK